MACMQGLKISQAVSVAPACTKQANFAQAPGTLIALIPPNSEAQQQPASPLNYSLSEPGPLASSRLKKIVNTATHALRTVEGKRPGP